MNTPSHLIITAALRRATQGRIDIPRAPFLLGAVMPDIPLWLLWVGAYVGARYIQGDASVTPMDERFDQAYFTNPLWIASHNMLHAPPILVAALALLWRFRGQPEARLGRWFWFFAGCALHSAIDIPVHVGDGPLLLFPLDWSTRFHSPVSYWDPRHYGREFMVFELLLDLALLAYLFGPGLMRRLRREPRG